MHCAKQHAIDINSDILMNLVSYVAALGATS